MCPRRSERPQSRVRPPREADVEALVSLLGAEELRSIVVDAAAPHEDVARGVRLRSRPAPAVDLTALRAEIDQGLRTRRFLGYREKFRLGARRNSIVYWNPGLCPDGFEGRRKRSLSVASTSRTAVMAPRRSTWDTRDLCRGRE